MSAGSKFQMLGLYLAGIVCLMLAVLKLTIQGQWSWWRVLLPLWVVLGHNGLYIVSGSFGSLSPMMAEQEKKPPSAKTLVRMFIK
jgi:hypothetical protein